MRKTQEEGIELCRFFRTFFKSLPIRDWVRSSYVQSLGQKMLMQRIKHKHKDKVRERESEWEWERERERKREREREREREQAQSNYTGSSHKQIVVQSPCISKGFSL